MPDNRDKFDSIGITFDSKALPFVLSPEEQAAFECAMENCYMDTCDEDSLKVLARNTGTELDDVSTIFEKLAKLAAVPIASGKSREPVVFMLDSLGALENKKC